MIYIWYMHKHNFVRNKLQGLICHKTTNKLNLIIFHADIYFQIFLSYTCKIIQYDWCWPSLGPRKDNSEHVISLKIYWSNKIQRKFVTAFNQTRLDTWSKTRRPIKVGIKGRGRSGTSRDSNPAGLCCSSAHLVQCEPDEASSFTNPNVGPGTYAGLWPELDSKV